MSDQIILNASVRETRGKAEARRMRRLDNAVPAILYGGKKEPLSIQFVHDDIFHAQVHEHFYTQVLELNIEGKKESVIFKAMQRHAFKPKIEHLDFLRINKNEALTMKTPIHIEGNDVSPGIKASGILSHLITELEITCLPADLPEYLVIDISALDLEQSLHISDIKLPAKVSLTHPFEDEEHDHAVVSISTPKTEEAEEAEEAASTAAAEAAEEAKAKADAE
jgi:large subunit ribosomal protein L25